MTTSTLTVSTTTMAVDKVFLTTAIPLSPPTESYRRTSRVVSFHDDLEVIEFPITIGDNPGCSSGAPLSMECQHQLRKTVSLDEYELYKQPIRRVKKNLALTAQERKERLLREGFTSMEINKASRKRHIARQRRKQTQDWMELDETVTLFQNIAWKLPKQGVQQLLKNGIFRKTTARKAGGEKFTLKRERTSMHGDLTAVAFPA